MKMRSRAWLSASAFLFLSLFLLASCGGGGGSGGAPPSIVQGVACPGTPDATVNALATSFTPTEVTISVNQIVQWTNNSGLPHTVTRTTQPAGATFDVALPTGASVCLKFTEVGGYDYYCTIHGLTMDGTVTVTP
jgi:plastocyanin